MNENLHDMHNHYEYCIDQITIQQFPVVQYIFCHGYDIGVFHCFFIGNILFRMIGSVLLL
jgi:hypothetical protein